MPPESSSGYLFSKPLNPNRGQQLTGALFGGLAIEIARLRLQHDVAERRAPFQQHRTLKHDADVGARRLHAFAAHRNDTIRAGKQARPRSSSSVLLPQPLGPRIERNSPCR